MSHESPTNLLSFDRPGLEKLSEELGFKPFHGRQVHAWIYRRRVTDFDSMTDLSKKLRTELKLRFQIELPAVLEQAVGDGPESATKFLLGLADGSKVEAVHIPSQDRTTLCLSSQVGCAYDCSFCATGRLGLSRNMAAEEIIGCYIAVCQRIENPVSNIVFMGMGEPLANRKNVMKAWRTLTDPDGIGISRRKVTISTVGLPAQVLKLAMEDYPPKLVFSIGSPYDSVRLKLMPVAGKFTLEDNRRALEIYSRRTRNRITIALLVAKDLNDRLEDAKALHRWIGNMPVKINLLRYNETDGRFSLTSEDTIEAIAAELVRLGRTVILRTSRGRDINAACGQLVARAVNS